MRNESGPHSKGQKQKRPILVTLEYANVILIQLGSAKVSIKATTNNVSAKTQEIERLLSQQIKIS